VSVELVVLALIAASVLGSLAIVLANISRIPRAAVGLQTGTVPPVLDVAGGARFGLMNYTAPMGRLRIWTDGLEVTAISSRASMAWSDIQDAVLIQPLIPVGMGVEFQVPGKARVTFWGSRADCLRALELCEANGVSVKRRRELRV
jgi:hypothetical protein